MQKSNKILQFSLKKAKRKDMLCVCALTDDKRYLHTTVGCIEKGVILQIQTAMP
jgi:hypothetical protein